MSDETKRSAAIPKRFNVSILLALLCFAVLGIAGLVCPVMAATLKDFGFETHWRHSACAAVHWQWTLPLGCLLAVLLVWKVNRLSLRANRVTNLIVFIGILVVAIAVLYVTMCFSIRGNTMSTPFGDVVTKGTL